MPEESGESEEEWRGVARCGECGEGSECGECGECGEVWRGVARCGEVWRGVARCGEVAEVWRGVPRCGEGGEEVWRTWFSPKIYAGSRSMPWRSARRMKPSLGGKSATCQGVVEG